MLGIAFGDLALSVHLLPMLAYNLALGEYVYG
jgi:hypothetical protein